MRVSDLEGPALRAYQRHLEEMRTASNRKAVELYEASGLAKPIELAPPEPPTATQLATRKAQVNSRLRCLGRELTTVQREYDALLTELRQLP